MQLGPKGKEQCSVVLLTCSFFGVVFWYSVHRCEPMRMTLSCADMLAALAGDDNSQLLRCWLRYTTLTADGGRRRIPDELDRQVVRSLCLFTRDWRNDATMDEVERGLKSLTVSSSVWFSLVAKHSILLAVRGSTS